MCTLRVSIGFVVLAWFDLCAVADYPRVPRENVVASPETVAVLRQFLRSEDPKQRSESLGMLRQVRDRSAAGDVRLLVNDPEPSVRAQSLLTLESLVPPVDLVPILVEKTSDSAPQVVWQALGILGSLSGTEAFDALLSLQSSLRAEYLTTWAQTLARRSEPVPTAIVDKLLNDNNPAARVAAAQIVSRQPESLDVQRRLALLKDPFSQVRVHAIASVYDAGNDPAVQQAVVECLNDRSSLVRRAAIQFLDRQGAQLQAVTPRLDDADPTVRIAAVHAVRHLGTAGAVTELLKRFADHEVLVAIASSDQLASIGGDDLAVKLVAAFDNPQEQVVRMSARTLGVMKHRESIDVIQSLVENRSAEVRIAAYEALGQIGDPRIVPWLIERAKREVDYPRAAVNDALGRLGDRQALPHLLADCHYPDARSKGIIPSLFTPRGGPPPYPIPANAVATAAIRSLGALGDTDAVPGLVEIAVDILRDEPFWTSVMTSLGQLGDARAKPALLQLGVSGEIVQGAAAIHVPPETRIAAFRAIARLRMTELVGDILGTYPGRCAYEVRQTAAEVLTELTGEPYGFRLPPRQHDFFVDDRSTTMDLTEFKLPICYRLNER